MEFPLTISFIVDISITDKSPPPSSSHYNTQLTNGLITTQITNDLITTQVIKSTISHMISMTTIQQQPSYFEKIDQSFTYIALSYDDGQLDITLTSTTGTIYNIVKPDENIGSSSIPQHAVQLSLKTLKQ